MKNKKECAVYVICYGLAIAALAFYLVTLYRGMHPNVSEEYQAVYLDQELMYWPGENGLSIPLDKAIHFDEKVPGDGQGAGHLMRAKAGDSGEGWTYIDDQYYGIQGWHARLLFQGEPGTSYHATMTLSSPQPGGEAKILVNGEQVAVAELSESEITVEFDTLSLPDTGRLEMEIALGEGVTTPVAVKELIFI